MSGAFQLLVDCPACGVECAVVELVEGPRGTSYGRCRLCALESAGGGVLTPGTRFADVVEVRAALAAWAAAEGEPVESFVEANFTGLRVDEVCARVIAGERVATSFDVVAWLFSDRTGGSVALGGNLRAEADSPGTNAESLDRGAGPRVSQTPVTPPPGAGPTHRHILVEPGERRAPVARDPLAVTRALVATALADGLVLPAEVRVLEQLCDKLGAPRPTPEDWRLWRPQEVGMPPDPALTIEAMRKLALADNIPDEGEARVIREYARVWRVPLPDPVLPPVTVPQKLAARWLELFGR